MGPLAFQLVLDIVAAMAAVAADMADALDAVLAGVFEVDPVVASDLVRMCDQHPDVRPADIVDAVAVLCVGLYVDLLDYFHDHLSVTPAHLEY